MFNSLKNKKFNELKFLWFACFSYVLRDFNSGFNFQSSFSLFWYFDMENWAALHKENTEYVDYSQKRLKNSFLNEINYCSDRMSFDRLFRCHWLFKNVYSKNIWNERFNKLYIYN